MIRVSNSVSVSTNINLMICILRNVRFCITLVYMNILTDDDMNELMYLYFKIVVCIFMHISICRCVLVLVLIYTNKNMIIDMRRNINVNINQY